jgi:hypothetical protein
VTLRQHPEFWAEDKGLLIDIDAEQKRIERDLSDLNPRIAIERDAVDGARLSRDEYRELATRETEAQTASNARLDALAAARAELVRRWTEAGQTGEPDTARVAQFRERIAVHTVQVQSMRAEQQRLVGGYRKWLSDEQLRRLETQIAGIAGREEAPAETEVRWLLESALMTRGASLSMFRLHASASTQLVAQCRSALNRTRTTCWPLSTRRSSVSPVP